ncbi:MAG: class I SAM-dependent methyltransferase [Hyphomonadaceae bacterium]|nr:class I SAM-dependent methyltransferase [Hyphomonadaceae bacterium]
MSWEQSAQAWIAEMGEDGDFARRFVLDPVMRTHALAGAPETALDVGCGEGRFCRALNASGVRATGLDPTSALIEEARRRDPSGRYVLGRAEDLPFADASFDLVVAYLSLIDIEDADAAMAEMARVLKPGGALLIANLTSFNTAGADRGWVRDASGARLHFPIDHYLETRAVPVAFRGIRIVNHHRPLSFYMRRLIELGLRLTFFDEPAPTADAPVERAEAYRRAPWFVVMEWAKSRDAPNEPSSARSTP